MAQSEPPKSTADTILLDDLKGYLRQEQADPTDHLAPYQAGLIFTRMGEFGEAVHAYQRAIERFPAFAQAYFNLGAAYSALGRHEEAEQAYRKAIELDRSDSEAWANLGAVQEVLGRPEEALASYRQAVELDPQEHQARLRMARLHLSLGDIESARSLCDAMLVEYPEASEAWNVMGLVRFHQGDLTGAEGCYHKALEFGPDNAQAWCNLANVRLAAGDDAGAEEAYRSAASHDERDPDIWFNLGDFYLARGRAEAERCLWQAVELNRADLEAWELLRRWYREHPNAERMHAVMRVLALARPDDTDLLREIAQAAEGQRELADAEQSYTRLLALKPEDETALLGLMRVHLKQGQVLEAYHQMQSVRSTTPDVIDQWIHLGHRLRHGGHRTEAATCFRVALEHRPDEPELAQYLGEIALEEKSWESALEWFERAGEMNRNDRHVWIPLMRHFYARKDFARAAGCLEHLDELVQYLPGLWVEFDEVYGRAGRREELLGRIERWLELGLVGTEHWHHLADLYERAGLRDRAATCRARATAPAAGAVAPFSRLEPAEGASREAPTLPVEGEPGTSPEDAEFWIDQGEQHFQQGRTEDALTALNHAQALDVPRFRAWFRIGALFYKLGRLDEAEPAFVKATTLNPAEPKGWYNLGVCQAEQGRFGPARESFRRALALQWRMGKAWDWLGLLHFDAGEHAEARRCFVRSLAVQRDAANAWHNLGMLYRAMGNVAESEHCLAQAETLGGVQHQRTIEGLRDRLASASGVRP